MNVSLGETFERYVQQQLKGGQYNNASEVIRDALRLKMQADEERAVKLEALRKDIAHARAQVRRGEVLETSIDGFLKRKPRKKNG